MDNVKYIYILQVSFCVEFACSCTMSGFSSSSSSSSSASSSSEESQSADVCKQRQIAAIMRDNTLDSISKQQRISLLMSNNDDSTSDKSVTTRPPCVHYVKYCSAFTFSCCNKVDDCHR